MRPEQVAELIEIARQRIDENLAKCRMTTGNGVNSFSRGPSQVIFLDPEKRRSRQLQEPEPWTAILSGYTVFSTVGRIDYPPPAEPVIIDGSSVSGTSVLLAASEGVILTNLLIDRLAYYQTQEAPASGFVQFSQTIYLSPQNFTVPFQVTFNMVEITSGGSSSEETFTVSFPSDVSRQIDIVQSSEGRKLVSAIAVERL